MDALTGAPVPAQPQPTGATPSSPLIPGQVISARVVQALAADTFLLAIRGQTLVAQSPTPLPLDTVVQLAVRSGGSAGEPVSVRLLPAGSAISSTESAPAALSARAIAAQLGLPESDLSAQLVAACQRQGVPLRPATVAPLLRLLQEAQEPLSSSDAIEASEASPVTTAATASAPGMRSVRDAVTSSARAVATTTGTSLPATDARETLIAGLKPRPASERTSAVIGDEQRSTPPIAVHPAGRAPLRSPAVPSNPTSAPAQWIPIPGMPLPEKSGPAIVFVPTFAAASLVTPKSTEDPVASGQTETHVEKGALQAQKSALPVRGEAVTAKVVPELAAPSRTQGGTHSRVPGGPVAGLPAPALPTTAAPAFTPASLPGAGYGSEATTASTPASAPASTSAPMPAPITERSRLTLGDSKRPVQQLQRAWSPGVVRAVAAMPVETRTDAVARLAASPLPQSAALLPLAAIAVQSGLPRAAQFLPQRITSPAPTPAQAASAPPVQPVTPAVVAVRAPVLTVPATRVTNSIAMQMPETSGVPARIPVAPAESTSIRLGSQETTATLATRLPALPFRESVDLAQEPDPRPAIRQGFALAGLVASAHPDGEPVEPPSLERLLTSLLSRIAASARNGVETAAAAAERSTVAAPGSDVAGASAPRHQATSRAHDEAPGLPAASTDESDPASAVSFAGNDLTAVHEQVARDLLPPQDLTEYERVLALPLAIAGQPLPARLAVTTRRSASGAQACWMRLDCELSRLGPVSVRLGGVEGAPVAITLVALPAAAAELAAALPQLIQDLHQLGVEAALRVVAEDEVSA